MKRVLTFFLLLLLFKSCAKEFDVLQEGETTSIVTFSASMMERDETTKSITLKDSWSEGDQIAIFIDNGDDTYSDPYCYDVATDGTMTPVEGEDGIIVVLRSEEIVDYCAFFPYDSSLDSYDEYKAASEKPNGDTDFLFTEASGTTQIDFTFSHTLAAVYFNVLTSSADLAFSYTLDGQFDSGISLDYEFNTTTGRYSSSFFIEETEDLSGALLIISVDQTNTYYSLQNEEITSWLAGKIYTYNILLSTGSGTESDPFVISSVEEMQKVGTGSDGWNLDSHYRLLINLDLEGSESNPWTPIGTVEECFTGTFDGNNKQISGLYINDSFSDYQGLFGCIDGATISNLGVSGEVTGYNYVGGLIGYASPSCSITNCYNSVEIKGGYQFVGGVVGYSSCSLTNCYNTAAVNGGVSVGGVVGSASDISLTNCYNSAAVTATYSYVGGIAGEFYTTIDTACAITNCYNSADITTTSSDSESVGGIVGNLTSHTSTSSAIIINCYNSANITAANSVGGIAGSSVAYESTATASISNCYSSGKVSGSSSVGGVVGDITSYSTVSGCYFDSDNYSGDAVGTETDADSGTTSTPSSDTVTDTEGKTTDEMQSDEFLYLLNLGTYTYNYNNTDATAGYYWALSSSYPTFDYDDSMGQLGSENNPFMIFSVEDMEKVGTDTDGWSLSSHYKLTVDINLEGSDDNQWSPIGTFSGSFDGNNRTISGLYIDSSSGGSMGLFSRTYGATIKNIGLKGTLITEANATTYVAGLIGYAENSSINNCYFDGSVTCSSTYSSSGFYQYVGGVVGLSSQCDITKCYHRGDISASLNTTTTSYSQNVGGVAGCAYNTSKLTNCYHTGNITAYSRQTQHIGGVIGKSSSSLDVNYCYNTGSISATTASTSTTQYLGGVIGSCGLYAVATLNYCYYNEDNFEGEFYNTSETSASVTINNSESKTEEVMKSSSFVDLLNSGQSPAVWKSDSEIENGGYPIFISE